MDAAIGRDRPISMIFIHILRDSERVAGGGVAGSKVAISSYVLIEVELQLI